MKIQDPKNKIVPCLWFDDRAEEAVNFYTSIFPGASTGSMVRYGESAAQASGSPAGSIMTVAFEICDQPFLALNGGPAFQFSPAISFMVHCTSQQEIDELWVKLSSGGKTERCGWLQDKFGISWQIVPENMERLLKDPKKAEKVMEKILTMTKLDIEQLKKAAESI